MKGRRTRKNRCGCDKRSGCMSGGGKRSGCGCDYMSGGGNNNNNMGRTGGPKYSRRKLNRATRKKQRSAKNRMTEIESRRRRRAALLNRNVGSLLNNSNSENVAASNTTDSDQLTKILDKFCKFLRDFKKLETNAFEEENTKLLDKIIVKKIDIASTLIKEFGSSNGNNGNNNSNSKLLEDPEYSSEVFDNFCDTVEELKTEEDAAYEENDQEALAKIGMKKMDMGEKILEKFSKPQKQNISMTNLKPNNLDDDLAAILNKLTL